MYNYDPKSQLEARVIARNRCHTVANRLWRELTDYFRPLVGKQILKAGGLLLAKVEKSLPPLPKTAPTHVFHYSSDYSLIWTVKCCEQVVGECHCVYEEQTFYVSDLKGQNMGELMTNHRDFRTDYNPEEITRLREVFEQKKAEANSAQSALWPFGEND